MTKPAPESPDAAKITPLSDLAMRRFSPVDQWRRLTPEQQVLAWMCLLILVNQLGFGSVVAVVALYADRFGVSQTLIGLTITVYGLARFLVNMPAGVVADRYGRRAGLAVGGVISIAGNLICGFAPNYELFVGGRFIAGAGASLVLACGQIILADIATRENRGRIMGTYQGVFGTAVGLGPMVGGVLATWFGLEAPFFAYSFMAGVVALLAWNVLPETRHWQRSVVTPAPGGESTRSSPATPGLPASAGPPPPAAWYGRALSGGHVGFWLISVVSFTTFFARTGALFGLVPLVAKTRLELQPDQIGFALGLAQVFALAFAYPSGWIADRYGRKIVIVPFTILNAIAMAWYALATDNFWFIGASLCWAVAVGFGSSVPAAYVVDLAPPHQVARSLGLYRTIADFGYVVGPVLLGVIGDIWGSDLALFGTAALMAIATLVFAVVAPESLRRRSG